MQPHLPSRLPTEVDFLQMAENDRQFEGCFLISELGRLHEGLNSTNGEVAVKLAFGWKFGIRSLTGTVSTVLEVICQRCLGPMKVTINSKFCLALIESEEEIDDLPDDMEPYLIEGEKQSVEDVVIDELLLSIPLVTKHDNSCSDYAGLDNSSDEEALDEDETYKPFASIKDLLN